MDRDLIRRAQAGDRGAYELVARDIARRLYLIAYRILRDSDAAEDATQQALVVIWREVPRLRDPDRFDAWTHRLIVRAALAEARRRRRHGHIRELDENDAVAADASAGVATRDELERAFLQLSPEHRAVIVLRYYADLPLADIAEALGVAYGTVGSRLSRAVSHLRATLGADAPTGSERGPDGRPERALAVWRSR